jgi:hypothetical protein
LLAVPRSNQVSHRAEAVILALMLAGAARGAEPGCGQVLVDGTTPPPTRFMIATRTPVTPFYQWESNNGYCGEVSLMQSGLVNGQWMSQYNGRLICGTGLSQSGPNGACHAHDREPDYNAQLLIEDPGTGVSGPHDYADAAQCMANARLSGTTFPYENQPPGMEGYKAYLAWVKAQVIAGNQVTVAVLFNGGTDPQYDHEVSVLKIGTNHAPTDPSYYPDDVLYFDDHGAYTLEGRHFTGNPAIPPGAGSDAKGCTPYVFGYGFGSLAKTRGEANGKSAQGYSIIIPDYRLIHTGTGGNGYDTVPILGPHNYAFSVSGPADPTGETLPVAVSLDGPTRTDGRANPRDPIAGWNYENPMIGRSNEGDACTNVQPAPMTDVRLHVVASGLSRGRAYNLYEYVMDSLHGKGNAATLPVPVEKFNANAALATHVIGFTALEPVFDTHVVIRSDKIVAFRLVPADRP